MDLNQFQRMPAWKQGMLAEQQAMDRAGQYGSLLRDYEGERRDQEQFMLDVLGTATPLGIVGGLKKVMIRTPWDSKILSGEKTMETATFGLPDRFRNVPHAIQNEFRKGLGEVRFSGGRKVDSPEEFDSFYNEHLIPRASKYHYIQPEGKRPRKYLWEVGGVEKYQKPIGLKPFKGQFRFQEELPVLSERE